MRSVGTPSDIAGDVAEILLASELHGIASHRTARLPQYVKFVETGVMDPAARPARESGKSALARFDANNGWGHHAARVAKDFEARLEKLLAQLTSAPVVPAAPGPVIYPGQPEAERAAKSLATRAA